MSYWGLMHPDYIAKDIRTGRCDIQYLLNGPQTFSWNHWKQMVRDTRNVSTVVINGDIVDGVNRHNNGSVCNNDPMEQCKMATMLIEMLPPDVPVYITKGTRYHSGDEYIAEQVVAEMTACKYADEGIIETCGIRLFANHYAPHAQYKAGMLERKIQQVAAAEKYYGKIDVIVRSHNHAFSSVMTADHLAIMTPGWQHKTPYAIDKDLIAPPDIGYVKLIVEDKQLLTVDRRGVTKSPFCCQVM
jgi:hypothetical protein